MKDNEDLEFQIIDIDYFHDAQADNAYKIRLFGKTRKDESVYTEVCGFRPHFYLEVKDTWQQHHIDMIIRHAKKKVWSSSTSREDIVSGYSHYEMVKKHKFYGFTNNKIFNFIKLYFNNYDSFRSFANFFRKKRFIPGVSFKRKLKFQLYESNIEPHLRFLHMRDINSVGWCKIKKGDYKLFDDYDNPATTKIACRTNWKKIEKVDCEDIHSFTILSFDLECTSLDGGFPQATRDEDKIIQIGMTYSKCGSSECFRKILLGLKNTDNLEEEDTEVITFDTESELLLAFSRIVRETDPDIVTGYNIYNFDFPYLMERAKKCKIAHKFGILSRVKNKLCEIKDYTLSSSALGFGEGKYYKMEGRIPMDLMKVMQRDHKLPFYKLDYVSSYFMREKISKYQNNKKTTSIFIGSTYGIKLGQYVNIYYNDRITDNKVIDKKFKVIKIGEKEIDGKKFKYVKVNDPDIDLSAYVGGKYKLFMCQAKDDVTPQQIFDSHTGTSFDRGIVGKYCIKDCELCNRLIYKLSIVVNNIGMANVCHVPLSYLFLRGQGVKIFSLVAKVCREENHLIKEVKKKYKPDEKDKSEMDKRFKRFSGELPNYKNYDSDSDDGEEEDTKFQGAIVFEPDEPTVFYVPVAVWDFASLYPSSMIRMGLSHEMLVEKDGEYDNLPDYIYNDISYKNGAGITITDRFAVRKDGKLAIIPKILRYLLDTRGIYKKLMAKEQNSFKQGVYNGRQMAYKVTANSLYGQTGASTSAIYMKEIAASTTATGRNMLKRAKAFVEGVFAKILRYSLKSKDKKFYKYMKKTYDYLPDERIMNIKQNFLDRNDKSKRKWNTRDEFYTWIRNEIRGTLDGHQIDDPDIIYGDTDSVFGRMNIRDKRTGILKKDKDALKMSIKLGVICEILVNLTFIMPIYLEYEKVLWPFAILTKKRYVGNLYEHDPESFVQKSMGIVTKRRDNADIVKDVVGGVIDIILNDRNSKKAGKFVQNMLEKIIRGKFPIEKFIITKTLKPKEKYADWTTQPHVVLAQRIKDRDPGNAPSSNERLPYAFVETKKPVSLQGDRVEHPDFIKKKKLRIDYVFYITNQIMKPTCQFLDLILKPGVAENIFKDYIVIENNRKKKMKPIRYHLDQTKELDHRGIGIDEDVMTDFKVSNIKSIPNKDRGKDTKITQNSFKIDSNEMDSNEIDGIKLMFGKRSMKDAIIDPKRLRERETKKDTTKNKLDIKDKKNVKARLKMLRKLKDEKLNKSGSKDKKSKIENVFNIDYDESEEGGMLLF